jgi:hypothetical protein
MQYIAQLISSSICILIIQSRYDECLSDNDNLCRDSYPTVSAIRIGDFRFKVNRD